MHQIIYSSYAVAPLTSAQLCHLLALAHRRNTELAVTGILLYGNERFVQVLEGDEVAVHSLYEEIKRDARHQQVVAYADKPVQERTFTKWAMAFQSNSPAQATALADHLGAAEVAVDVLNILAINVDLVDVLRDFTLP